MHYVPTGVTVDPAIVHPFSVITELSSQEVFIDRTELHVSKVVAVHIAHSVGHFRTLTDTLLIPQDSLVEDSSRFDDKTSSRFGLL
jgi:hypothetical protein